MDVLCDLGAWRTTYACPKREKAPYLASRKISKSDARKTCKLIPAMRKDDRHGVQPMLALPKPGLIILALALNYCNTLFASISLNILHSSCLTFNRSLTISLMITTLQCTHCGCNFCLSSATPFIPKDCLHHNTPCLSSSLARLLLPLPSSFPSYNR